MEIGVAGPIITQKNNTRGSMGQRYPYPTTGDQNIVAITFIYGDTAIYYFVMITKTLNWVNR